MRVTERAKQQRLPAASSRKGVMLAAAGFVLAAFAAVMLLVPSRATGLPFATSAHGNTGSGVYRTSITGYGYSRGNCAHCHEQHGTIAGIEPNPAGGSPSNYTLFSDPFATQTNNFCLDCHTDSGSLQQGGITNRSYSYRAGGWTGDFITSVSGEFAFPTLTYTSGSAHNLSDMVDFLNSTAPSSWGYSADSSPCTGCHNPHSALKDPKTVGSRIFSPVSLPSLHSANNTTWGVFGASNKMSAYSYQAPYRYLSTVAYEPDGSATTNGSNLIDFVMFCTDCHNTTYTIKSSTINYPATQNLRQINWNTAKHGQVAADGTLTGDNPYTVAGKVLSCADCHEPHGSPSKALIRSEVNGGILGTTSAGAPGSPSFVTTIRSTDSCPPTIPPGSPFADQNKTVGYLCNRCHKDDSEVDPTNCSTQTDRYYMIHHDNATGDPPYPIASYPTCSQCHQPGGSGGSGCGTTETAINCNCCHYHGSTSIPANGGPRTTF